MRLFIAVNFSDAVLDAIEASIDRFAISRPPWRWSARPAWHVTLKFLGETPSAAVDGIAAVCDEVAAHHAPFDVTFGAFDGFPNLNRPRVLFYDIQSGAAEMGRIAAELNTALAERLGIRAETKPFRAHATLARIKTRIGRPAVQALKGVAPLEGVRQTVTGFDLMESQLGPRGSRYTLVKPFALGNSA